MLKTKVRDRFYVNGMFSNQDLYRIVEETFIRHADYYDVLSSTNDRAIQVLPEWRKKLPALIIAGRQTAGRGRGENKWFAGCGALTFSILVEYEKSKNFRRVWPRLSMWTAIALRSALAECLPQEKVQLKWPNDVFVNGCKVSGILVEIHKKQPDLAVVGIGINVNNSLPESFPLSKNQGWARQAISMYQVANSEFSLLDVLLGTLRQIENRWQDSQMWLSSLGAEWGKHCFLTGKTICWSSGTREISGVCCGIDDEGAISIAVNGQRERCFGGVIKYY